ncbi:ferritin-like domain-containing protein [Mucilaginibacter sp. UR6-11]|uniref:ferritin-like domain-containing protein n=1 Tax=Mucilaginibacter sp. UR6-11 TaxID=1435644 RepID=UPI001E3E48EC|nr:ferritin-like domain-containing protein [Mucilaginibacter sp. UR6-11]MCC8423395.1 ferritin-like domain-containing protein [Mucilaginibacter sp. UR6-11]
MKPEKLIENAEVNMARRSFLRYAGAGVAAVGVLSATSCSKTFDDYKGAPGKSKIDIGATGDLAILNYAYALEQLEAAFYINVAAHMYTGASADEIALLTDIRDHEVAHREFFKAALGTNAIPALTPNFNAIDFSSRSSVLAAARAFEDTGVTAYNGAGYLIQNPAYLTLAGKIVSVEARHAAYIRNLITPGSFADTTVLDANGMDKQQSIAAVLGIANSFLTTKVSASSYGYVAS